jgi:hypothetical protein
MHKDAGSTQQIQFTEQQAMPRKAEGSADIPSTWGALWSQPVCYGFCNELSIRQGLERIWRFALRIVILLG